MSHLLHFPATQASLVAQVVKNPPAVQETWVRSLGWEDSPGGGHGNSLQYSCLQNPMDRGAWQATVHGVTKSQTRLSDYHFHFHAYSSVPFTEDIPQIHAN